MAVAACVAEAGIIETVVGGSNGDGYTSDVAKFVPQHITFDGAGNLLIADTWDQRIRQINGSDIASTLAGSGVYGFNGDGILAVQAKLAGPVGITIGADKDIYFSDQLNQRVRKIDTSSGLISTVVGTGGTVFNGDGLGTAITVNYPAGLFTSSQGILIADSGNQRVRLLDSRGYVTTIAGTGGMGWFGDGSSALVAKLSNPTHAVADNAGNIYIADKGNCRVRRISPNGIISTFAGMAEAVSIPCGRTGDGGLATVAKLNGPSVLALDPQQQYLYILDSSAVVVRRVNLATGVITHVAGTGYPGSGGDGGPATQAALGQPTGLAFNSQGDLYIADANLRTIRRINVDGIIDTIAGGSGGDDLPSEVTRLSPKGLAMDPWGNLQITDATGNQSRIINTRSYADTLAGSGDYGYSGDGGVATNADLAYPVGIAVDSNGRTCFSDQLNHRVRCVNPSSHVITTLAGTGQAMWNGDGSATAASLNYPAGLLFDDDNSLLIADSTNHRIRRVKDGAITTVVGTGSFWFNADGLGPLATNINNPTSIALDSKHNLYIAEKSSCRIRKYDVASGTMLTIGGTGTCGSTGDGGQAALARLNGPENLAISSGDILFFTESSAPKVRQIDLNTGIITRLAGTGVSGVIGDGGPATSAQMMRPSGLLLDPSEAYLFIGDFDAGNVRRVALDGGGAVLPSSTPSPTGTPTPLPATPTPLPATPTPLPPTPTQVPPTATFTKVPTSTVTRTETPEPTNTSVPTSTNTFTRTATATPTFTRTGTATRTPILTSTPTNTVPATATPTDEPNTPTPVNTPLASKTPTDEPTIKPTGTNTPTLEPTDTRTETPQPTETHTRTVTPISTSTGVPTNTKVATSTVTRTRTLIPTVTRTPTKKPTSTATRTITATRTNTRPATATATRTVTRTRTSTIAPTSTRTSTRTITRTSTRTPTGGSSTPTPTAEQFVSSPTVQSGTATRTRTRTSTPIATRTSTRVSTPTLTRTATATRTQTKVATATRTRTATITRTPTRTLTGTKTSIVPTSTPTLVPTNTPTLTPTPTVDPLRSDANIGPRVTWVGLSSTGFVVQQPDTVENGVPVYRRASGSGFYLVVEGKRGSGGITIGRQVLRSGTAMADFQVEVNRNVGDGSATLCDQATGGAPGIDPIDFNPSAAVINATSDFTCGFTSTISSSATVTYAAGQIRSFVAVDSTVQFSYLVGTTRAFALGDTLFTVRILDINGNPGPIEQMIIRVG